MEKFGQIQGSHDFGSDWTAQYDSANDFAASFTGIGFVGVLMGLPTFLSNQYNHGYFYFEQQEVGCYEDLPGIPPSLLDSWAARGLTWTTARATGMPDNLIPGDHNNFGPRIGAAIRPARAPGTWTSRRSRISTSRKRRTSGSHDSVLTARQLVDTPRGQTQPPLLITDSSADGPVPVRCNVCRGTSDLFSDTVRPGRASQPRKAT